MRDNLDMLWQMIVDSYTRSPRDVQTVPLKGNGIWFYAFSQNGEVCVSQARSHFDSSQVQGARRLDKNNCDAVFQLYQRRKAGEPVSQEATALTQNQVYWYGIFHDLSF